MIIAKTVEDVRHNVQQWRSQGLTVGFVATMGYLHDGHASLMDAAARDNDRVVVSIFVNPMQFGPKEDLASYPRDFEHDSAVCDEHNVDMIFHPSVEEMYGDAFYSFVDMNTLTEELCGASRPAHFRGVCTVVLKLFNIVAPDRAYFGEKDAQQLAVVKRMVKDLNMPLEVVGCPTVREEDGLAKSSRNAYLSQDARRASTVLFRALEAGRAAISDGERSPDAVISLMTQIIDEESMAKIDYVKIVDSETIQSLTTLKGSVLVALSVFIGKTKLIDNFIQEV